MSKDEVQEKLKVEVKKELEEKVIKERSLDGLKGILKRYPEVNLKQITFQYSQNLLHCLCDSKQDNDIPELLEFLIDKDRGGINIDATDEYHYTALFYAAHHASLTNVECLLDGKPDLTKTDSLNRNILHFSAKYCSNVKILEAILRYVTENKYKKRLFEQRDREGNFPIHYAVKHSNKGVIKELIKNKPSLDTTDLLGRTPLHIACHSADFEMVELLVNSGADCRKNDRLKRKPITYLDLGQVKGNEGEIERIKEFLGPMSK